MGYWLARRILIKMFIVISLRIYYGGIAMSRMFYHSLLPVACCCLFSLLNLSLWGEEPTDELAKQLGCTIDYHKVLTEQTQPPKTWVIPEQMAVRVTDAAGHPVPGASVCLDVWFPDDPRESYLSDRENQESDPKTDQNGALVLPLNEYRDKTPGEIVLTISHGENYLPFRCCWQDHPELPNKTIDVPEELDVTLEAGEMVTYTVLDENGKGIPDVKVSAVVRRGATFKIGMLSRMWSSRYVTMSDAEGKFRIGPLALNTGRDQVDNIKLRHPDYAGVEFDKPFGGPKLTEANGGPSQFVEKTLEEKSIPLTLMMHPGCSISGTVVDHEGKPLEGVGVYHQAKDPRFWPRDGSELVKTDGEGRFRFDNLMKGEYTLGAGRMPGKYADAVTVDLATDSEPVKFVMKPTHTVRIRAVTEDGQVLPKIRVHPYLEGTSDSFFVNENSSRTLEDGTWEWFEVPPDKDISYSIYYDNGEFNDGYHNVKGYVSENAANQPEGQRIEPYKFPPREEPYIVKMVWQEQDASNFIPYGPRRSVWAVPRKMVFRILDSETGLPAPDTTVMMQYGSGSMWGYGRVAQEFQTDQNGLVGLDFSDVDRKGILFIMFRVEKENYTPWEFKRSSDPIRGDNRTGALIPPVIDVLLSHQGAKHGIVLDENRKPIQGAKVIFGYTTTYDEKTTRLLSYSPMTAYPFTMTDELGRWSRDVDSKNNGRDSSVFIQCEGYVNTLTRTDVANGIQILHQGKEVKGRVLDRDGNPISGARVYVQQPQKQIANEHVAVTDDQGVFTHFLGTTVNGNQVQLTAIMEGKTPVTITVDPSSETAENVIVLTPGNPLKIRLKTTDGSPLPPILRFTPFAFSLSVKTSDGYNLGINANYKVDLTPDANGVIDWPDAPDVETEYSISFYNDYFVKDAYGRSHFDPLKLKPRPKEYVFEVGKHHP